jgi:hypothetical protein
VPEAVEGRHVTDTVEEACRSGDPQIFFVSSARTRRSWKPALLEAEPVKA